MIDVKQAIRIAQDYMHEVYGNQPLPQLMLEEVELTEDEKYWLITYGFDTERIYEPASAVAAMLHGSQLRPVHERTFKILKLRADDGKVLSMKIRRLPEAVQ